MTLPIAKLPHSKRLSPEAEHWLRTGERSAWYYLQFAGNDKRVRDFWDVHCDAVVAAYAREFSGYRPKNWWTFSSPEPRRRLGGVGSMLSECSNCSLTYTFGIPTYWKTADEKHLPDGTAIDNNNPPLFESEGAYLRRLGLLLPGEAKRLRKLSYCPIAVTVDGDEIRLVRVPLKPVSVRVAKLATLAS
jgi:hypothetical protein